MSQEGILGSPRLVNCGFFVVVVFCKKKTEQRCTLNSEVSAFQIYKYHNLSYDKYFAFISNWNDIRGWRTAEKRTKQGSSCSERQLDMLIDYMFANRVLVRAATESMLTTAQRTALLNVEGHAWKEPVDEKTFLKCPCAFRAYARRPACGGGGADCRCAHLRSGLLLR